MPAQRAYPSRFGNYVLIAPLARGGMGELHLALGGRADVKKLCVIKQIIGHLANADYTRRFADEATLMVKLSHGNLVPVFEGGTLDGQYYIVMEYIEGRDLRAIWRTLAEKRQAFPLDVALHITKEICRGLHYAHTFENISLVHRDISPPNVLLSFTGEVKITDFGLASSTIKLQKTAPGILFGKLAYMAPEQARNEPLDARADIYATGVVLWEMLTGRRLFPKQENQARQLKLAANPEIPPPSLINPSLPPALDLIVLRALAKRREDRYPDAEQLRADIAGFLAKIDPTTDAAAVERLLLRLYGGQVQQERLARQCLIDEMSLKVQRMLEQRRAPIKRIADSDRAETVELNEFEAARTPSLTEDTEPPPALEIGTILEQRYRIEELLREGGMGTVYRATHIDIDRRVAVKVLHPAYSRMPDVVSRFRREARAASRIGHPNIVEVYDFGITADGSTFLVMEFLVGQDLADVLGEYGTLSLSRSLQIAIDICHAVGAAHDVGIVHRDLKPENVFVMVGDTGGDHIKILDFGIAQTIAADGSHLEQLTNPGMPIGTPNYMAPEQAAGVGSDHRADIYALGTLLYEMLTGSTPNRDYTLLTIANKVEPQEYEPPSVVIPEIPAAVDLLIGRMLSLDPDRRPNSMAEVAYELNKIAVGRAGAVASMLGLPEDLPGPLIETQSSAKTATTAPAKSSRRFLVWLPATVALLAIVAAVALRRPAPRPSAPPALPATLSAPALTPGPATKLPSPSTTSAATPTTNSAPPSSVPSGVATGVVADRPETTEPPNASRRRQPTRERRAANIGQTQLKRGRLLRNQGDFAGARVAFRKASSVASTRARALTGLAELAFQSGALAQALRFSRQAVQSGGGIDARLILANVHFKRKRYKEAAKFYRWILRKRPNHPEAQRNLDAAMRLVKPH
ncbi:MAG: protein kinase [Deltaproteobacteria bacterium]|nr:protein kinase [Deltaproteobacteria bacterium]